ncbi:VOC family protein [Halocatena pleomorpha]|uniref:Ring-cleaving dioxygenase n=1 Tax=Halocatena pleomorpha TaxID=1785090 RepID=A0A3P3RDU7_9EURY|nr:VOC family protein [Halocatena pleomorpha]RRJ31514.1 ring-cleaving dioxygenase [Halocatena pleomorpha]
MGEINGLHHITAFASNPQENLDFFQNVLGMRFIKRTVRFDVPEEIYHLYYGDEVGTAGSIVTFFPIRDMPDGEVGKGQISGCGLIIPEGSVSYWEARFDEHGVEYVTTERFNETAIEFTDPDGTPFELVTGESEIDPWDGSDVPPEHGVQGLHSATIHSNDPAGTFRALKTMGWERVGRQDYPQTGDRVRFEAPGARTGADFIDVLIRPNASQGVTGTGTFLHVAFDAGEKEEQKEWSDRFRDAGLITTSRKDRDYFWSMYFTEPGGAVFEFATTGPGMTLDENIDELGEHLRVPDWLDVDVEYIDEQLPDLTLD